MRISIYIEKVFHFDPTTQSPALKLLEEVNPPKSAWIDNLAGKFLKEGAPALASPVKQLKHRKACIVQL